MRKVVDTDVAKAGNLHHGIDVQSDPLVVRFTSAPPRQGWEEQFQAMAAQGDDRLLDPDLVSGSQWDQNEWEW